MQISEILSTRSFLFIDAAVESPQHLLSGLQPDVQAHILKVDEDGIQQITEIIQASSLTPHPSPLTLHIVSHGTPGCLYLGNAQLSLETLDRYSWELQTWFPQAPAHNPQPKLSFYACNLAAGDAGEEFITKLQHLTGAEIHASTQKVGHATLGGSWELDTVDSKQNRSIFSSRVQEQWVHTLNPVNDSSSGDEDTVQNVDVRANDSSPSASISIAAQPTNGTAVVKSDGTVDYTPDANFSGADSFEYQVHPDYTTANPDRAIATPGVTKNINVLFNDVDAQADPLTVTLPNGLTSENGATLAVQPDGTIDYTPSASFLGLDSFTYQIDDGNGNTDTATVAIDVRFNEPRSEHYLPPRPGGSTHADNPMKLLITTEQPTATGVISFPGTSTAPINFSITEGTSEYSLTLGTTDTGGTTAFNTVGNSGIKILTDSREPVNVQLVQEDSNGQSFLSSKGLDALGTEFYAGEMADENAAETNAPASIISVMATENNTQVTFQAPNAATWNWAGTSSQTQTVTLQAGETYIIQPENNTTSNITGAYITSTKPIAVSNGNFGVRLSGNAVDNGWDQLVPVQRTGSDYVVVRGPSGNEEVEIIATKPNTQVFIDGTLATTLANAGDVYTTQLTSLAGSNGTPYSITTSENVYLFQSTGAVANKGENGVSLIPSISPSGRSRVRFRTPADPATINIILGADAVDSLQWVEVNGTSSTPIDIKTQSGYTVKDVPGRTDVKVVSFKTSSAQVGKEYYFDSQSFIQVGILAANSSGGGFAYVSGFSFGPVQASNDVVYTASQSIINVLGNDYDANSNPLTIDVVGTPTNGTTTLNSDNTITYTPNPGYIGPDSFTYSISDNEFHSAQAIVYINPGSPFPQATVDIEVKPVADPITVSVADVSEDFRHPIPLAIGFTPSVDTDGSETPTFQLNGVPSGSSFVDSNGTPVGTLSGSDWVFTAAEVADLNIQLPANFPANSISLDLIATNTDAVDLNQDGDTADADESVAIATNDSFNIIAPPDNDGDGVPDEVDLDSDNDGITDANEGVVVTLDQVSSIPAGAIPGNPDGLRLSDATGQYVVDIYNGLNTSTGAAYSYDTNDGRIGNFGGSNTGDSVENNEVVEMIYTTINSPTPFQLSEITILDINSLSTSQVRDAYAWSESGTWTPLGTGGNSSPAGSVVSVDTSTANDIGDFVLTDPDGSNDLNNLVQFTQVTAVDDTLSDVLVNMEGENNGHNVLFNFDTPQTTASLFAFNSGSGGMGWNFFPQFTVKLAAHEAPDTDSDGVADFLDLDSDNDGISDLIESGQDAAVDLNEDGIRDDIATDPANNDTDGDGLADAVDGVDSESGAGEVTSGTTVVPTSTDTDGTADFLDLDSDDDGIPDAVEAQSTTGYVSPELTNNATNSGVNDTGLFIPVDTDNDGIADYIDTDSDDGLGDNSGDDAAEAGNLTAGETYTDPDGSLDDPSTLPNNDARSGDVDYRSPNSAPTAVDNGPVVVIAGAANILNVVADDTDPDGDSLAVTEIIDPSTGTPTPISVGNPVTLASGTVIDLLSDGTLSVTPPAGVTTSETFDYTVSDGALTDTATVSLDPNTAPDAVDDGPVVVTAGIANNIDVVGANDIDIDNDTLTITEIIDPTTGTPTAIAVGSPVTLASGTVVDLLSNGTLNVTPPAGASIPETFNYTLSDGHLSDTATVTLYPDTDGDGVGDFDDLDSDNDGILDTEEGTGDLDGDGIPNYLDLDTDGDGLSDLQESGLSPADIAALDTDNDGVIDPSNTFGLNGLADDVETAPESGTPDYDNDGVADEPADTDGDGVDDYKDLDSDNDGINDVLEVGGTDANGDGLDDNTRGPDADLDGIPDALDPNNGGTPVTNPDTDGDTIADFRDLDSDNDGINDVLEGGNVDSDGDGLVDGVDTDGDGILDAVDPNAGFGDSGDTLPPDTDSDGVADNLDLDSDDDGINDVLEGGNADSDGDGLVDGGDTDGDGILDAVDPNAGFGDSGDTPPPDTDGDGVTNNLDLDSDNDGTNDVVEGGNPDADGDGLVDGGDTDGDGIADAVDPNPGFGDQSDPLPPNNDTDPTPDYLDTDSDNDGTDDVIEGGYVDSDGDGEVDGPDGDKDGISDIVDGAPSTFGDAGSPGPQDTDDDGIPDIYDIDSDNDGIVDTEEGTGDLDGDGIPNYLDLDTDGDGLSDLQESGLSPADIAALDTDNDGVIDPSNTFGPNGLADAVETAPESGVPDYDGDGIADEPVDTDGDGVDDYKDLDSDNDGINDVLEVGGTDTNGDGLDDNTGGTDTDGDGIPDALDPSNSGTPVLNPDTDGDTIADFRDLDSDNDGINDVLEGGNADSDGDGLVDGGDTDGDGILDAVDPNVGFGDSGDTPPPDTDGDGVTNNLDLDSDNDGTNDVVEGGNPDADGDGLVDGPD
ncbi:DUF4347 domain-containing protein, partial [Oscillatoria sp. CS-180]|uniref:Ig-like domain-containing protein n=1 Tax=Oscillatoria sp. CS-180 TaxID=3021720 RepID=UPI00232F433D